MELNWKQKSQARVLVTSEIATEWLKRNKNNRKPSKTRVADLVRVIEAGRWSYNGQSITFDCDGRLTDGQHRLMAIAESNKTCELLVCTGLDRKAAYTQDTGKNRGLGEQARREGVVPQPTIVAQWAQTWIRVGRNFCAARLTTSDLNDWYKEHQEAVDWLLAKRTQKALFRAAVCMAFVFAYEKDKARTNAFVDRFSSGANLRADDPAYHLREQTLRNRTNGHTSQLQEAARTANALYLDSGAVKVKRLVRSDEALIVLLGLDQ